MFSVGRMQIRHFALFVKRPLFGRNKNTVYKNHGLCHSDKNAPGAREPQRLRKIHFSGDFLGSLVFSGAAAHLGIPLEKEL